MWRFIVGPAWQNLTGIYIHTRTKKLCNYSDSGILEKSNETETFINGYLVPHFESEFLVLKKNLATIILFQGKIIKIRHRPIFKICVFVETDLVWNEIIQVMFLYTLRASK